MVCRLDVIAPFIPTVDPQLSEDIYEMVLNFFLRSNHNGFLELTQVLY